MNTSAVSAPAWCGETVQPRMKPGPAETNADSPEEAPLNMVRTAGARLCTCTITMLTMAPSTAYCQPNRNCVDSRNTKASETVRPPCSSSGTGLYSAASAATKNSATPTAVPASGGADAILRTAPTATGIVNASITATNRSSRGGYVWDEFVTA